MRHGIREVDTDAGNDMSGKEQTPGADGRTDVAGPAAGAEAVTAPRRRKAAPAKASAKPKAGSKARPKAQPETHTPAAPRSKPRTRKAAAAAPPPVDPGERLAMVARAAYFRAEKRGFAPGGEWQDWMEAEIEVDLFLASRSAGKT